MAVQSRWRQACRGRGYTVAVAESLTRIGGRVARECQLPGLSAWGRVVDYRQYQLSQRPDVEIYLDSELSADDILMFGFESICIATGATWRADGVARQHVVPMPIAEDAVVYTLDDLMGGSLLTGKVIVFELEGTCADQQVRLPINRLYPDG